MFYVLNYAPRVGWSGTKVAVETLFYNIGWHNEVHIRIVIGFKPIPTDIENVGGNMANLWRCTGLVPEFEVHKNSLGHTVAITIQALDKWNTVLDSVTFGYFTYWEHGKHHIFLIGPCRPKRFQQVFLLYQSSQSPAHPMLYTGAIRNFTPPSDPLLTLFLQAEACRSRFLKHETSQEGDFEKIFLEFAEDPTDLGKNLTEEELRLRRRLVRFLCKQDGDTLRISFHTIRQEDYDERLLVISCIYREDIHETCFTSVDVIRLVGYLVQANFNADERSRIRRNLEFLHPITVSKTRMASLFQLLMDFPAPKPRNIEKDLKVFKWDTLVDGLNKVMEKYSFAARASRRTGIPVYDFHDAPQHPASYPPASLTTSDGTYAPHSPRQHDTVPSMHINPLWLHPQGAIAGSPKVSESLALGGDLPNLRLYMPSSAIGTGQSLAYDETFHHFDSLEFQALREHNAHAGVVSQFF
ncbi:hypothetical protein B0F90DRAFT_1815057 [Multifurca ochricompacta]|uniref:DUF7082 domain-containing protein n=1 Tax=Multifurca ochricompacta TaxID=376703 RepID=A0AAD4MA53_9AGAM|nr:hypothetical protein B0F90DRAFT_1815057 [Multifurca ochricompacta]